MKRIYLDHTATTPLDPRVFDAMRPYFFETFGNASSVHWYGRQAKTALEHTREVIASVLCVQPGEVFFTSGGTESDNLAIRGVATAARTKDRRHIITSKAEHHAVLDTCESLESEGFEVTYLDVDGYGMVAPEQVRKALKPSTCLVTMMHANNEVGTISPVKAIAEVAHEAGAVFHTDAVQSCGKIPADLKEMGVDLASISAHKMYGPKGIGALYVRKGTEMNQLFHGGGQERNRRPGTENIPGVIGFGKAVELASSSLERESARLAGLRDTLEKRIRQTFPAILVNGHPTERLPHILNVSFDAEKLPIEGEMLLMNMDLHGVAVTSGSACTSGSMQPSHVLLAMGRDPKTARATLRFAFGQENTEDDIQVVIEVLGIVVQEMSR